MDRSALSGLGKIIALAKGACKKKRGLKAPCFFVVSWTYTYRAMDRLLTTKESSNGTEETTERTDVDGG